MLFSAVLCSLALFLFLFILCFFFFLLVSLSLSLSCWCFLFIYFFLHCCWSRRRCCCNVFFHFPLATFLRHGPTERSSPSVRHVPPLPALLPATPPLHSPRPAQRHPPVTLVKPTTFLALQWKKREEKRKENLGQQHDEARILYARTITEFEGLYRKKIYIHMYEQRLRLGCWKFDIWYRIWKICKL